MAGLSFLFGCLRLGYDVQHRAYDGGVAVGMDAAVSDAGNWQDAAHFDAGQSSAMSPDASTLVADAGAFDAGKQQDSAVPGDAGGAAASHDAGAPRDAAASASDSGLADSGLADSGSADAAVSGTGVCAVTVTTNTYDGKPHYHGRLVLKNVGDTTWTLPTISFDLPSTANICNDADVLPGAGWTLQSSAGHCEYTRVTPALSIGPEATLSFEYSSDYRSTLAEPAVIQLSVLNCK
jgi:hypothetical protein